MNVVGTLNSFSNTAPNSYKVKEYSQEREVKELEVEVTFYNPYKEQGVSDELWRAFSNLSEPLDLYSQKFLEDRLFADANFDTDWREKVTNLHKELNREYTNKELLGFVHDKNTILNQFNQPHMSPSEENFFIEQIKKRVKQQATLLDGVLAVIEASTYKPLELAA